MHSAVLYYFCAMKNSSPKSLKDRLIQIGYWEGISYLLLLGVAMPLKYIFNLPMAVTILGLLHGFLFVWFCLILLWMEIKNEISIIKSALAVLLSMLPFGTFFLDKYIFPK